MNNSVDRNSVLLIHGLDDTTAIFKKMTAYLVGLGWDVHSINLIPNNGDQKLDVLAKQIEDYAEQVLGSKPYFDLVGFSMGGLVSRYYVQRLGGINRVQRLITIASPHQGTLAAYLTERPGCVQMRPHSNFLQESQSRCSQYPKPNKRYFHLDTLRSDDFTC